MADQSKVDICNNSLLLLGDKALALITDDTDAARYCNRFYDRVVKAVLRSHPWNCATEFAELAADATAPLFDWDYRFPLPTDPYCLRVRRVEDDPDIPWVVKGRYLLCNTDPVKIEYTRLIVDPRDYDPLLYDAIVARLASDLAYPITGKLDLTKAMFEKFKDVLADAQSIDGLESNSQSQFTSDQITAVR